MSAIETNQFQDAENEKFNLYRDYVKTYRPMIADILLKQNWNNKKTIDENDVNDLLQETILLYLEKRMEYGFQLTSKESTFIYGLALNKTRNFMRSKKKNQTLNSEDIDIEEEISQLENNAEMIELLKRCIELLSRNKKEIIRLQFTENESKRNIAKFLGLSDDNVVRTLSYRAKQEIKQCIESKKL